MTDKFTENMQKYARFEDIEEVTKYYADDIDAVQSAVVAAGFKDFHDKVITYRFLKGWKFDPAVASDELIQMLKWREANDMDKVRDFVTGKTNKDFPHFEEFVKCYPINPNHGTDKSGQPLNIAKPGHMNMDRLLKNLTLEQLSEYFKHDLQSKEVLLEEKLKETGKLYRYCRILDLEGLGTQHLNQAGLSMMKEVLGIASKNFPELLGSMYIVNAPWVFTLMWKAVSPWLKESTQKKIKVLGEDYKEKLLELIDEETLPSFLGGKCTCGGEGCVPDFDPDAGLKPQNIAAGGDFREKQKMKKGDMVMWSFRPKAKDIGFTAVFKYKDGDKVKEEVIEASTRYDTNKDGSYTAKCSGVIVLMWDNSYSMFTSKDLLYRVEKIDAETVSQAVSE